MIKGKRNGNPRKKEMQIRARYQLYFFHMCEYMEEDKITESIKLELNQEQLAPPRRPRGHLAPPRRPEEILWTRSLASTQLTYKYLVIEIQFSHLYPDLFM